METWNSRPGGGVPRASSWTCRCNLSFFPEVRDLMLACEWKPCYHCNQISPVYSKHCRKQCSRSARQTGLRKSFLLHSLTRQMKTKKLKWTCINTHADCCLHPAAVCLCRVHCCCKSHTTSEVLSLATCNPTACWWNVHLSCFFNVSVLIV